MASRASTQVRSSIQTERVCALAETAPTAANVKAATVPGYLIVARDSLVGNQIARVDVRLTKTFTLKDRIRFMPMVEAFNLFNHSNFGSYSTNINVASYGTPVQNTDLAYAPRMLQFAGRIEF